MTTITAAKPPQPWAHQTRALEFIRDKPGAMLAMEMGTGKDLDDHTPISTTKGWTPMGELQVGQQVFDERGQVCNVTKVFPQGERPVYRVEFDDGAELLAGADHLWLTLNDQDPQETEATDGWAQGRVPVTTMQIRDSLREGHHIPRVFEKGSRRITAVIQAGTARTTCITVDSPSGLFQAGRPRIPTHNTKVAIDHMEELEARRTLVLAPLSVVDHVWPREIRTHGRRLTTIISLGGKFPNVRAKMKQAAEGLALATARKGPAVVIVNYESACREPLAEWLKNIRWDLFVMDEAHRLKSPSGQISRFASQLADRSARRLALTGTPMPHSPMDIYAQYRAIDKRVYGVSYGEFKTRYAEFETVSKPITTVDEHGKEKTHMPQAISGYQNLDELNQKFYTLAFLVTAAETLDLPGAIETYTHVELGRKARHLYDQMAASFIAELETGEKITAANALARLVRFQQLTSGFAATPEGKIIEVDEAKAKALADILEDLPRREPVVVFARFQNDLDTIARIAGKMKRPSYEISGRIKSLDEWNADGGVLAVQIQAGGLGLDLTAARYCVYYSLGFSLGDYLQSIARLHRPGQTSMVDYIHLVAAASIDEIIAGALANKEDVINRILETKDLTNGSLRRSR